MRSILLFLFAICLVFASPGVASAVTSTQSIALPVYEYPTLTNLWPSVDAAGGDDIPFVVVNPASGPGGSTNSDYTSRIAANTAAGIRSIGYVDTNYQTRPIADVISDIDAWHTLYPGISGILFDRVSVAGASDLCYSAYGYNFAKSRYTNDLITHNFGTYTSPAYEPYGDIFINAEMDYALYQTWSVPNDGFQDNAAYSNRFWHLIHTTSAGNYPDALTDTRNNNAGWVYITDDIMPNPYDAAPSYFSTELTDVRSLPSSTIPNRGSTNLPAGCMDMNLTTNSTPGNRTISSTHTLANTSSTYTAFNPNKLSFALPTGVTLASATGTSWTCSGTDCTYTDDLSPSETSSALAASFDIDCSYASGDITVAATSLGAEVGNSNISVQKPTDCPAGSTATLAETGSSAYVLAAVGGGAGLVGVTLLYRYIRRLQY